jgi:hypothetical protein
MALAETATDRVGFSKLRILVSLLVFSVVPAVSCGTGMVSA